VLKLLALRSIRTGARCTRPVRTARNWKKHCMTMLFPSGPDVRVIGADVRTGRSYVPYVRVQKYTPVQIIDFLRRACGHDSSSHDSIRVRRHLSLQREWTSLPTSHPSSPNFTTVVARVPLYWLWYSNPLGVAAVRVTAEAGSREPNASAIILPALTCWLMFRWYTMTRVRRDNVLQFTFCCSRLLKKATLFWYMTRPIWQEHVESAAAAHGLSDNCQDFYEFLYLVCSWHVYYMQTLYCQVRQPYVYKKC